MRHGFFSIRIIMLVLSFTIGSSLAFGKTNAATHTVIIEGMKFHPDSLSVHPGDTVIWVNKDIVPHTATGLVHEFNSGEIPAEHSWKHRFAKPGEISYACSFHPTMKAAISVK
jgi:plastocyanin